MLVTLAPGAAGAALKAQADALPRPRAIIIVSPHWQTESTTVGTADRLETIHDFTGFPDALYAIRSPASGCGGLQHANLPRIFNNLRCR